MKERNIPRVEAYAEECRAEQAELFADIGQAACSYQERGFARRLLQRLAEPARGRKMCILTRQKM